MRDKAKARERMRAYRQTERGREVRRKYESDPEVKFNRKLARLDYYERLSALAKKLGVGVNEVRRSREVKKEAYKDGQAKAMDTSLSLGKYDV